MSTNQRAHSHFLGSLLIGLAGLFDTAVAAVPDNRLCIEETAPPGSPLTGGYAELSVIDQRLGRAQVYGTACFQNPLLGNAEQCFPVDGAMVATVATNSVSMSLAAAALATVPGSAAFYGFAQQYLELDATTLVGMHRTNGFVVQGGEPSGNYIEGTAHGVRCVKRPRVELERQRLMSRFVKNLDAQ